MTVEGITFKEFMKRDPKYIRIWRDLDQSWRLYGSSDVDVKIYGKTETQNICYQVLLGEIQINVNYRQSYEDKTQYNKPTQLNFHDGDCDTLKTLLAHNPDTLSLEYWLENLSENARKQNQHCETMRITGSRKNKTHKVHMDKPHYFGSFGSRY